MPKGLGDDKERAELFYKQEKNRDKYSSILINEQSNDFNITEISSLDDGNVETGRYELEKNNKKLEFEYILDKGNFCSYNNHTFKYNIYKDGEIIAENFSRGLTKSSNKLKHVLSNLNITKQEDVLVKNVLCFVLKKQNLTPNIKLDNLYDTKDVIAPFYKDADLYKTPGDFIALAKPNFVIKNAEFEATIPDASAKTSHLCFDIESPEKKIQVKFAFSTYFRERPNKQDFSVYFDDKNVLQKHPVVASGLTEHPDNLWNMLYSIRHWSLDNIDGMNYELKLIKSVIDKAMDKYCGKRNKEIENFFNVDVKQNKEIARLSQEEISVLLGTNNDEKNTNFSNFPDLNEEQKSEVRVKLLESTNGEDPAHGGFAVTRKYLISAKETELELCYSADCSGASSSFRAVCYFNNEKENTILRKKGKGAYSNLDILDKIATIQPKTPEEKLIKFCVPRLIEIEKDIEEQKLIKQLQEHYKSRRIADFLNDFVR